MENKENMERYKDLSHKIDEWLAGYDTTFSFDTEKIWREFNVKSRQGKQNVHKILGERIKADILEFKYGKYRKKDKTRKSIDFMSADSRNYIPIKFPKALLGNSTFGLESLVRLYPKSIVVVAGTKGGSKTAWCLNIVRENMNSPELRDYFIRNGVESLEEPMIAYFTNELSPEELKDRLENFEDDMGMWNFIVEEKYDNFADAIYPNKINIIDALEKNTEAYVVADLIDEIHQALDSGMAIISMHKNLNAEYAAGGIYSAKKARLYLILQNNVMRIKHSKKSVNGQSPEGRAWAFKLVNGAKYTNIYELDLEE